MFISPLLNYALPSMYQSYLFYKYFPYLLRLCCFQEAKKVDFSDNEYYEEDFKFYDHTLLDAVKRGDEKVCEFWRLLALCHTVMPDIRNGK